MFVPIPTYPEFVKLITSLIILLEPLCILNIELEFDIRQSVFDVELEKMLVLPLINSIFVDASLDERISCNRIATLLWTIWSDFLGLVVPKPTFNIFIKSYSLLTFKK